MVLPLMQATKPSYDLSAGTIGACWPIIQQAIQVMPDHLFDIRHQPEWLIAGRTKSCAATSSADQDLAATTKFIFQACPYVPNMPLPA
jgi:hypothetical protein